VISALFVMFFQAVAGDPAPPSPAAATPAASPPAAAAPVETETAREARLRQIRERAQLVCRNEHVSGSRLPTRRCTSKAEDDAANADSRAWIDRAQSQMPTKG